MKIHKNYFSLAFFLKIDNYLIQFNWRITLKKLVKNLCLINILLTSALLAEEPLNIAQEATNLKYELDKTIDDATIQLINDSNYSGPIKEKAIDQLSKIKIVDEEIKKVIDEPGISDVKKGNIIKKIKRFQKRLDKKINKAEKKERSEEL